MQGEEAKEGAGTEGLADVKERLDGLNSLYRQVQAARKATSRSYAAIVVILLVVMLLYGFAILRVFTGYMETAKLRELGRVMTNTATEMVSRYQSRVQKLVMDDLLPKYLEEMQTYFTAKWPELEGELRIEARTLYEEASAHLEETATATQKAILEKAGQSWRDKFKDVIDVTSDEQMDMVMANIEKALQSAFVEVVDDRVDEATERVDKITKKILKFLPEDRRGEFNKLLITLSKELQLEAKGGLSIRGLLKEKE